jgi:hypothetical protein
MREEEKIGESLSKIELPAPAGLLGKILFSIARRERRSAILALGAYSGASVLAAALLAFSWSAASTALQSSGTFIVLSLIFSDFHSVLANWNYFILSIAESLPVFSIILFLLSASVLSAFSYLAVKNIKSVGRLKFYGLKHA